MPVEIRELIIKATVSEDTQANQQMAVPAKDREQIIEEAVRQVMQILKEREER